MRVIRVPTPRSGVFPLYWRFAAERQAIFEHRLAGRPRPWTNDPILDRYKFCNVYRAADRVSQYMIATVIYGDQDADWRDTLFRIVAFRIFSNIRTWNGLTARLGRQPTLADLRSGAFAIALDAVKAAHGGLYTGAFILCATKAFGFDEKHHNHVALFEQMFLEQDAADRIRGANSLEQVVAFLQRFPLTGPFMAYQTAIDLNYSALLSFDENDFTQAGPGALRGIAKAFSDTGGLSPSEIIMWMVEHQSQEFAHLDLRFDGLWGRPLHAIDCQGLFCELDKYCREAVPDLKSARSRIKSRYKPASEPLAYFLPPKWRLTPSSSVIPVAERSQFELFYG